MFVAQETSHFPTDPRKQPQSLDKDPPASFEEQLQALKAKLQKRIQTVFEDSFSEEVWTTTYKDYNDQNINDTLFRVAAAAASVETTDNLKFEWTEQFYDLLSSFKATAGGRIYANAGAEWNGTTLMNCFTPDVQVLTSIGLKRIYDIEIGDFVLTHRGRFRKVMNTTMREYSGPVQRFRSAYFVDDIVSTPEHPYYQGNKQWTKSTDVYNVALLHRNNVEQQFIVVDLAEILHDKVQQGYVVVNESTLITKREYIGGNGALGTKRGHSVQRFVVVDANFAYLLGRFVGDGCTFRNNNHPSFDVDAFTIAYNTTTEMQHVHQMVKLFEQTFGITPNIITSQNNTTYVRKASLIVAEVLRRLIGDGFDTKRIPSVVWASNNCIQRSFLQGLYDADGFVTSSGELQIEMTNKPLIVEIQTMITSLGTPSSRSRNRLFAGSSYSSHFRASLSKVYEDDRLARIASKTPTTGPRPLQREGFLVTPERIDESYTGVVYNISVDEDESYVVNNVVVHNCYVGPRVEADPDSLDGIFEHLRAQAHTLKSEGGWGENFSYLRPRGTFINGIGVETPGAVKYMELFDKTSDIITAGSGRKSDNKRAKGKIRKGAMMGVMDCWHGDIIEFITAKQNPGRLTKFNISVNCTDEFMNRIVRILEIEKQLASEMNFDEPNKELTERLVAERAELDKWNLIFPDTTFPKYKTEWTGDIKTWKAKGYPIVVHNTVSATWLWNLIMESTYNRAEPGILFLDRANYFLPLNYAETVYATNPCGEQTLAPSGVCNLGSLNLTQFVSEDHTEFDLKKLEKYTRYLVRFLDNINDLTKAPLPAYEHSIRKKRRIGVGILGWGSALYMLKTRFASESANKLRDEVMGTIARTAYMASIDLAEERGMFEYCEPKKHAEGPFVKSLDLPKRYMEKLAITGIRNSSLLSIQPTGNTSILANIVSGGLEPVFLHDYIRTVIVGYMPKEIADVTPKWYEGEWQETKMFKFSKEGDEEILKGKDSDGTVYKIDKNRGLTKEVLCEDYGVRYMKRIEEWDGRCAWTATALSMTVADHVSDLTGFARWVDSAMSKTVNVPHDYSFDDFENIYLEAYKSGYVKGVTTYRSGTMTTVLSPKEEMHAGPCDEEIIFEDVKLPDSAPATMKTLKAEGRKWYLTTIWNDTQTRPFGFFVHTNHYEKSATTNDTVDVLTALARKKGIPKKHIDKVLEKIDGDNNVTKVARMISLNLRHGVLIRNIVASLEKVEDVYAGSFLFAIKKFLSSYIKDGEKVQDEKCLECNSEKVVYQEGCKKCISCGSSKCG